VHHDPTKPQLPPGVNPATTDQYHITALGRRNQTGFVASDSQSYLASGNPALATRPPRHHAEYQTGLTILRQQQQQRKRQQEEWRAAVLEATRPADDILWSVPSELLARSLSSVSTATTASLSLPQMPGAGPAPASIPSPSPAPSGGQLPASGSPSAVSSDKDPTGPSQPPAHQMAD
jgi:hypothetical protein